MIDFDKIGKAKELVEEVAAQLNAEGKACGSCGHVHYGDWNEKQMKKELEAMARKLGKYLSRDGKRSNFGPREPVEFEPEDGE